MMILKLSPIPKLLFALWLSVLGTNEGTELANWKSFPNRVERWDSKQASAWATYVHRPSKIQVAEHPAELLHEAYFHPLKTPKGQIITEDYPQDHLWQRGLWIAWTRLSYDGQIYDFWNQGQRSPMTAKIYSDRVSVDSANDALITHHRFVVHPSPTESRTVIEEKWIVRTKSTEEANVMTLESIQTNVSGKVLRFSQHPYGGLGLRTRLKDSREDPLFVMTSESHDRFSGNAQPAKWVWLGEAKGGPGILLLIHQSHPFFPVPLRINPKHSQLSVAPSIRGDWELPPSHGIKQKFRVILMDQTPSPFDASQWWKEFQ